jgi:hypothetical protein
MKRGYFYQYVGCKSLPNNVKGKKQTRMVGLAGEILVGEKHPGIVKYDTVSTQPAKEMYSTRSSRILDARILKDNLTLIVHPSIPCI